MASIFSLFGEIFIDNKKANEEIDKTTQKGESAGSKIGKAFGTIGKAAVTMGTATIAGATALGGSAYKMAMSTAEQADYIDKLSERTGINREELQRWKHAADQSGASVDSFKNGIKKMTDTIDSANQGSATAQTALERLGLSLDDLNGMTTEQQFDAITAALADMEEGAERNAIGNDLLGKTYTEMLPLLNAGSDGIKDLKQEADDLGIVMSEDTVKAGVKLGDTIANVKDALNGFKNQIGAAAIPIIQKFADMLIAGLPKVQSLVEQLVPVVTEVFDSAIPPLFELAKTIFPILLTAIQTLLPPLQSIIQAVLPVLVTFIQQLVPPLLEVAQTVLPSVVSLITDVIPIFMQILETILPVLIELLQAILPTAIQIVETILPVILQVAQSLLPILVQIVDTVMPLLIELINAILPLAMQIIEAILPVLLQLFDALMPFIQSVVDNILPVLIELINSVLPLVTEIINAILPVLIDLLNTLLPALQPLLDLLVTILEPITTLLESLLPPLMDVIKYLFEALLPPLEAAFKAVSSTISDRFKGAFESIKTVFNSAKEIFNSIIDFVKNVFTGNWRGAWQNIVDIFGNIFSGIGELFKAPINWIIDGINGFINGINSLEIPDWVPGVGGYSLNIPNISRLRIGLDYVPYDEYPALLHKGEQVLTASEREEYQERKSSIAQTESKPQVNVNVSVNIENIENKTEKDIDEFIEYILQQIEEIIKRKGAVFG